MTAKELLQTAHNIGDQFGAEGHKSTSAYRGYVALSQATTLLAAKDAEIERLTGERDKADNALVDKYRDAKTGHFSFPGDVGSIVLRLEAAEASLTKAMEVLKRIAAIKHGNPNTLYAQKAFIDYAREQARDFLSEQKP